MTIQEERNIRTKWFCDARFGMFIHWGLYAIPSRCIWSISREPIPKERYESYMHEFNPTQYDPALWARIAKNAGMKYAVLTTKQHDGFSMFDSALTDYKVTNTPIGRDLVKEYVEAFRAEGLKVGFYYSLLDWHHPDYPHFGERTHPLRNNEAYRDHQYDFDRYLDFMHGQIRELCTNYGEINILWLDFSYGDKKGEAWRATELVKMIRSLQPNILIDNRLSVNNGEVGSILSAEPSLYAGDFASPEQIMPPEQIKDESGKPVPWEMCLSMNDNWGYVAADKNYKPGDLLIQTLVECVAKGGNLLLNVGPDAKGRIPEESVEILGKIGNWMKENSDSIYCCSPSSYAKPEWGWFTQNEGKLYAHIQNRQIGPYHLPVPASNIEKVRILRDGSELLPIEAWSNIAFKKYTCVDLGFRGIYSWTTPLEPDIVLEIELKQNG